MIHWYPGHMAKALRLIKEKAPIIDLFIVVLDGRAPLSTYNEDFDKIAPQKSRLFVITKIDLADNNKLKMVSNKFNHENDQVLFLNLKQAGLARKAILKSIAIFAEIKAKSDLKKGIINSQFRVMVIGIPNSGKSTLINTLSHGTKVKTGNLPGLTRGLQWVAIKDNISLLDTPGVLWPKMHDQMVGLKLALIGSIKIEALNLNDLFYDGYELLSTSYPEFITKLGIKPTNDRALIYQNLAELCQIKHFMLKNHRPDLQKGMQWFIFYMRDLAGVTYDELA